MAAEADRLAMPPPAARTAPSKRKQVLDEDVYAGAIEAIVERDFFPHLPKLQNQLEWLQAVQSGDPALIKRAQLNIARRRAGLRTPVAHDGSGAPSTTTITPGTGFLRTPAMTPAGGPVGGSTPAPGCTPAATTAALQAQGVDPVSAQQQVGTRAPAVSLDQFFSAYEGEDNASFQVLHEQTLARKRAKVVHHLEDKNTRLLLEAGNHSTDEYGTSGQAPSTVLSTKHTPKNLLYYDSSQTKQLALSQAEKATIVAGPPKVINLRGTRSLQEDVDESSGSSSSQQQRSKAAGAIAPGTQGYGYMRTPQIVPGVDASPLMTWGDIASTPLRLDEAGQPDLQAFDVGLNLDEFDEAEAAAAAMGKQFTLPEVRSREAAARQLMAKKAASARRQQPALQRSSTPLLNSMRRTTGLRTGARSSTPGGATPGLSAAGLKLAQQLKRPGTGQRASAAELTGGDKQLRASYQQSGSTPARPPTGHMRPSGWEPTPNRSSVQPSSSISTQRPLQGNKSTGAGKAPAAAVAKKSQTGLSGNITDGLLQLG